MKCSQRSGLRYRPLNALLRAFTENPNDVAQWLSFPSDFSGIDQAFHKRKSSAHDYSTLGRALQRQYRDQKITSATRRNLEAIGAGKALTVTTGHQVCLMGGPAYFIYKIISTISLARILSERYPGETIVPVFWMATEDHDKEEIAHCFFQGKKVVWNTEQTGAVGRFTTEGIQSVIDECRKFLPDADATKRLFDQLSKAYDRTTLASATRDWVNALFGDYGLVVLDADDAELKALFKDVMQDEVRNGHTARAVIQTSEQLEKAGYHPQVNPRDVNLFYLTESDRSRIVQVDSGQLTTERNLQRTREEVANEIDQHPERFSPNVILRPLYQERILPNLAYVGGPGEIAYWLQLKSAFDLHNIPYPVLILRDSALVITPAMNRKMMRLGITVDDLFASKDAVLSTVINFDETALDVESEKLRALYEGISEKLSVVDQTLRAATAGEAKRAMDGLENLKAKLRKAIKTKQETKVNQLNALWSEAFPEGQPQDRVENFFSLTAGKEQEVIEHLVQSFNPLQNQLTIVEVDSAPSV